MKKNKLLFTKVIPVMLLVLLISGCGTDENSKNSAEGTVKTAKIKIGLSMGTLQEERWQTDLDVFVARAKELSADVIVQNADNDTNEQINQVKYLLDQGIDVLVIVPQDAERFSSLVQLAKKQGTKVISYDRLIRNANVDMYISFDNVTVGKLLAQYLLKKVPRGNYEIINGSPTDYNCTMINKGYMQVLLPYIENGSIKIVDESWAQAWKYELAFESVQNVLQRGKKIDGIIAGNDNLAAEAIKALSENQLAGKVQVVGQDADLSGCQRVVEGMQLMTVYKPIDNLAKTAAEIAISMAKGEQIKANSEINDGKYNVPYYMLQPIPVTKENMVSTIIHDGFHRLEDVYTNVPKNLWPKN
ncbi:MAG: substrate-binding domain-containing protein [Bacillota bacterium]|nr:substrate-binding domain-containing protein [Bacillota bacterium]